MFWTFKLSFEDILAFFGYLYFFQKLGEILINFLVTLHGAVEST